MRLRTLLNDEPKHIAEALESCDIRTDEDLLYSSDSSVGLLQKLPPNSVAFLDLERIQEKVLHSISAYGRSGAKMYHETGHRGKDSPQGWSIELSALDYVLQSSCPGVIEVAGRKGSGKTVSILTILSAIKSSN